MTVPKYTARSRESLISAFLDGEARESYAGGRLFTRESPDGDGVQLVAYGDHILAEIDGSDLELYIGHHGEVSPTLTGYVKILGRVVANTGGLEVSVYEEAAPMIGYGASSVVSDARQFIQNYVGDFTEDLSDVEQDAISTVERALRLRLHQEFGDE